MSFSIAAATAAAKAGGVVAVGMAVGRGVGAGVDWGVGAWVGTGVGRAVGTGGAVGGSVGLGTGVLVSGTDVGGAGATTQLASSDAVVAPSSPRMSRRRIRPLRAIIRPSASGVPERLG